MVSAHQDLLQLGQLPWGWQTGMMWLEGESFLPSSLLGLIGAGGTLRNPFLYGDTETERLGTSQGPQIR